VTAGRPPRRIGAVVHPKRPAALFLGKKLAEWAAEHGVELRTLHDERGCLGEDVPCCGPEEFPIGLDMVVVLGGDGTLLRALGLVLEAQVPVLGVNLGRLGFLTEIEPDSIQDSLEAVWAGNYRVERRTTLCARVLVDGEVVASDLAVNDVVFEKAARERLASLAVSVGERLFARYAADGLIVATPTGSTAYSFSAGGPLVSPKLDALLLTPIAPHMVFNRTLVFHPDEVVRIEVLPDSPTVVVESVDGRAVRELPRGSLVEVVPGDRHALLVRIDHTDFFGLVRSKFRLADAGETVSNDDA